MSTLTNARYVVAMGHTAIVDTANPHPIRSRITTYQGRPVHDLDDHELADAIAQLEKENHL